MNAVLAMLVIICAIAALMFIVRLSCAPFSEKVSHEMQRHPVIHIIWAIFSFGSGFVIYYGALNHNAWPPDWVERQSQRRLVEDRVQSVGGWETIKKDCEVLAEKCGDEWFSWNRFFGETNELPSSIVALKPIQVKYFPPESFVDIDHKSMVPLVRMKLFGLPSTGGNASPYLALEVVCSTNTTAYEPKRGQPRGGAPGNRHSTFRKVAENVFEIY